MQRGFAALKKGNSYTIKLKRTQIYTDNIFENFLAYLYNLRLSACPVKCEACFTGASAKWDFLYYELSSLHFSRYNIAGE